MTKQVLKLTITRYDDNSILLDCDPSRIDESALPPTPSASSTMSTGGGRALGN
jgi:hypothetical protein